MRSGNSALLPELTALALIVLGVWFAGDRARLRRAELVALREHAERVEREAERERRLAAAEERTRIARELHDSAGHAINVILVQAGAARLLHDRAPERSRRALLTIEQVARDAIGEIDRLVRALRTDDGATMEAPPTDAAAFEELVQRHRAAGLSIASQVRGSHAELPRSVAWAAYRILQEALTNAARHGRGDADVSVLLGPEIAEIVVINQAATNNTPANHALTNQAPSSHPVTIHTVTNHTVNNHAGANHAAFNQVPANQAIHQVPVSQAVTNRAVTNPAPARQAATSQAPNHRLSINQVPANPTLAVHAATGPTQRPPIDHEGHGIIGMRERATLLGGTLYAGAAGGVFRLHAQLPYRESVP